jgi:hypothetical protein
VILRIPVSKMISRSAATQLDAGSMRICALDCSHARSDAHFMQVGDAEQLRREWVEKRGGACDHASLQMERDLGADTGDHVCDTCGASGGGRDWPQRAQGRNGAVAQMRHAVDGERKRAVARRDFFVQELAAADAAGDALAAAKASTSRDACDVHIAWLAEEDARLASST